MTDISYGDNTVRYKQFVGSRYVPIFGRRGETSWQWDNSAAYEALTIVQHEGVSYTSKKAVPAGIDIENTEYWAVTGQYNAQIEQYRRDTKACETEVTALQSSVNDLAEDVQEVEDDNEEIREELSEFEEQMEGWEERISDMEEEVEGVQTSVTNLTTRVTTAEGKVTALEGKDIQHETRMDGMQNSINSNAANIANHETRITALEDAEDPEAVAVYASMSAAQGTKAAIGQYIAIKDGSIWKVTDANNVRTAVNRIDVWATNTSGKLLELVINQPLKADWLMWNSNVTFVQAVTRGFEISDAIELGASTYTISSTLTIPDGCTLKGQGWHSTRLNLDYAGTNIYMEDLSEICELGLEADLGTSVGVGIDFHGRSNWGRRLSFTGSIMTLFSRVFAQKASEEGSDQGKSGGGIVDFQANEDCEIMNGLLLRNCNDFYLNNFIMDNKRMVGTKGISLDRYCEGHIFEECDILGFQYPLYAEGYDGTHLKPAYCWFTDCMFDSGQRVALLKVENLRFSNCWFSNGREYNTDTELNPWPRNLSTGMGCSVDGNSQHVSFVGCSFWNNGGHGLWVQNAALSNIVGCNFCNWGNNYNGAYAIVTTSGDFTTVTGCAFDTPGDGSTGLANFGQSHTVGVGNVGNNAGSVTGTFATTNYGFSN